MNADDVAKIDWSKIAMGIAVAIVFVLQQYHAMKLEDVRASVVPRHEYTKKTDEFVPKTDLLFALKDIEKRIEKLEKEK